MQAISSSGGGSRWRGSSPLRRVSIKLSSRHPTHCPAERDLEVVTQRERGTGERHPANWKASSVPAAFETRTDDARIASASVDRSASNDVRHRDRETSRRASAVERRDFAVRLQVEHGRVPTCRPKTQPSRASGLSSPEADLWSSNVSMCAGAAVPPSGPMAGPSRPASSRARRRTGRRGSIVEGRRTDSGTFACKAPGWPTRRTHGLAAGCGRVRARRGLRRLRRRLVQRHGRQDRQERWHRARHSFLPILRRLGPPARPSALYRHPLERLACRWRGRSVGGGRAPPPMRLGPRFVREPWNRVHGVWRARRALPPSSGSAAAANFERIILAASISSARCRRRRTRRTPWSGGCAGRDDRGAAQHRGRTEDAQAAMIGAEIVVAQRHHQLRNARRTIDLDIDTVDVYRCCP